MSTQQAQVDAIVREVLRRLRGATGPKAVDAANPGVATPGLVTPPTATALVLSQRLITQEDLTGRLDNMKSVIVPPRAVVTPAARDYLRERGVELLRGDRNTSSLTPSSAALVVGVAETSFEPSELLRLLRRQGIEAEQQANTGLITVVDELAGHVSRGGRLGLLLTERAATALCLANRIRGVRAAVASDAATVAAAIRDIGVNLLIVEPRGRSLHQLKQIVDRYASGSPHACPPALAQRLG